MATVNTVTDEYVLRAKVDDQMGPAVDGLKAKLVGAESQLKSAQAAVAGLSKEVGDSGVTFSNASRSFDAFSVKYDAVSRAAKNLAAAQKELADIQRTGNEALTRGDTTLSVLNATVDGAVARINRLSTVLGTARAEAEANALAQRAWDGSLASGTSSIEEYAAGVATAAEAAKAARTAFAAWFDTTSIGGQSLASANAGLDGMIQGLVSLRGQFDPLYAAEQRHVATLAQIDAALQKTGLSEADAAIARQKSKDTLDASTSALAANGAAQEELAGVISASFAALDQYNAGLDAQRAGVDSVFRVSQQYAAQLEAVDELVAAGNLTDARALVIKEQLTAAYAAANDGSKEAARAAATAKAATDASIRSDQAKAQALVDQRAKYDPLFRAQQEYSLALAEIAAAEKDAGLAAEQADVARGRAQKNLEENSRGFHDMQTASAGTTREIIVMAHEVITGNFSRIPGSLLVLGERIGGIGEIASKAWALFLTPQGLILGAMAALTAASVTLLAVEQAHAAALNTLQQQIRGVSDNYVQLGISATEAAHAIASTSNISAADARAGVEAFATSGAIDQLPKPGTDGFAALIKTAADASVALGITVPDAEKKFAAAILDVGPLVSEFANKQLFGMNSEFERQIKNQVAAGDAMGAFARVMEVVRDKTSGAIQPATDLGRAWLALKEDMVATTSAGTSFSSSVGEAISAFAQTAIAILRGLVAEINAARDAAKALATAGHVDTEGGSPFAATADPQAVEAATTSLKASLASAAQANGLNLALLTALQHVENQAPLGDGTWRNSVAGAVGSMQVMPATFAGMQRQPDKFPQTAKLTDLSDPAQNVIAGSEYFAFLLGKYNSVRLAILAYHDGETTIDGWLTGRGTKLPSAAAMKEADDVSARFSASGVPVDPTPIKTPADIAREAAINAASKQTVAGNPPAFATAAAAADVEVMEKGLAALGDRTDQNSKQFDAFSQQLDKNRLALQNSIPAVDQQGVEINKQVAAAEALTKAYGQGLDAQALTTARNLAMTQVDQSLSRTSDEYRINVERLTQANLANAQAQGTEAATRSLSAQQRQLAAVLSIADAEKAGLPQKAQAIALEAARASLIASNLNPDLEANAALLAQTTQGNLDLARAQGNSQLVSQIAATERATDAQTRIAAAYRVSESAGAAMQARIEAETAANNAGLAGTDAWSAAVDKNTGVILANAEATAKAAAARASVGIDRDIADQTALAAAYDQGAVAVVNATAKIDAQKAALASGLRPETLAFKLEVIDLTAKELERVRALEKVAAAQDKMQIEHQTALVKTEISSLGLDANTRTLLLSHMQAEYDLRQKLGPLYATQGAALLKEHDDFDALNLAMQQSTQALSFVSGQFSQAFDTIGNAMSQAFISGQGAAVNWANVMTAVVQQVIQAFIKLAVLNPVLNSLFGQNNTTLLNAVNAIGGGTVPGGLAPGSTVTGPNGSVFTVSNAGTLVSAGSSLSGAVGGPTIGSALGLTGPDGALTGIGSSLGLTGPGGFFSTGATAADVATASAEGSTLSLGAGAGPGGAVLGVAGPFAAGIGGGFALGSIAGGLVQGGLNKTGPAPEIGAGLGAVAGAGIGFAVGGPVGAVIGGLLGGTIGGAGGGLIGPHVASSFSTSDLGTTTGQFSKSPLIIQRDPNGFAEDDQMNKAIAALNVLMSETGVIVSQQLERVQLGDNNPGGFQDPSKFQDLNTPNITGQSAFQQFRFSSTSDPILNDKLTGKVFASTDDFQSYLTQFEQVQTAAKAAISGVTDLMKPLGVNFGTVYPAIAAVMNAFDTDKTNIDALLNSGFLSDQQVKDLTKAESDLKTVRDKGVKAINDLAAAQVNSADQTLVSRQLNAAATISGTKADAATAQLYTFDINAAAERVSFAKSLTDAFGDAFATTTNFAGQMALEEKTLGAERVAIQSAAAKQLLADQANLATQQTSIIGRMMTANATLSGNPADVSRAQLFNFDTTASAARIAFAKSLTDLYGAAYAKTIAYSEQLLLLDDTTSAERVVLQKQLGAAFTAAQTAAASFIGTLNTFVQSLLLGSQSILSPKQKLDAAQADFVSVTTKAGSGDQAALGQVQNSGTALLTAAQAYYGSSLGYVSFFNEVLTSIKNLGNLSPTALTNAFAATATPAATLGQQLAGLSSTLKGHADGGWISNGTWNRDTVTALLAGGEYVVNAPSAARYSAILPQINAGSFGANDNQAVIAELRALRAQAATSLVAESRSQTAQMIAAIQALRAEVTALRADIRRGNGKPGRLAA